MTSRRYNCTATVSDFATDRNEIAFRRRQGFELRCDALEGRKQP